MVAAFLEGNTLLNMALQRIRTQMEAHNSDFIPKIANYKDFVQCNAEPFWKEHSVHLQNIVIVISTM